MGSWERESVPEGETVLLAKLLQLCHNTVGDARDAWEERTASVETHRKTVHLNLATFSSQ